MVAGGAHRAYYSPKITIYESTNNTNATYQFAPAGINASVRVNAKVEWSADGELAITDAVGSGTTLCANVISNDFDNYGNGEFLTNSDGKLNIQATGDTGSSSDTKTVSALSYFDPLTA